MARRANETREAVEVTAAKRSNSAPLDERAELFQLLGSATRLRILVALARRGEASVGELATEGVMSHSVASRHLAQMRRLRVITARRDAQTVYYRYAASSSGALVRKLLAVVELL